MLFLGVAWLPTHPLPWAPLPIILAGARIYSRVSLRRRAEREGGIGSGDRSIRNRYIRPFPFFSLFWLLPPFQLNFPSLALAEGVGMYSAVTVTRIQNVHVDVPA